MALKPADKTALQAVKDAATAAKSGTAALANPHIAAVHERQRIQADAMAAVFHDTLA